MRSYEYDEIERLPEKYRPLNSWGYFWLNILYSIPVIGWIFLIVFACSDANISRRSHARSYFCALVIALVLVAIFFALTLILRIFDIDLISVVKDLLSR